MLATGTIEELEIVYVSLRLTLRFRSQKGALGSVIWAPLYAHAAIFGIMKWLRRAGDGFSRVMEKMEIRGLDMGCEVEKEEEKKGNVEEEMKFPGC